MSTKSRSGLKTVLEVCSKVSGCFETQGNCFLNLETLRIHHLWLLFVEVVTDYAKRALYIVNKCNFVWCLADSICLRTENQKVDSFALITLQLCCCHQFVVVYFLFLSFFWWLFVGWLVVFFLILPLFVVFWYFFLFYLWLFLIASSQYSEQPSLDVNCTAWKMQITDLKITISTRV